MLPTRAFSFSDGSFKIPFTLTLHFPQVPFPPQGVGISIELSLRNSKIFLPGFTLNSFILPFTCTLTPYIANIAPFTPFAFICLCQSAQVGLFKSFLYYFAYSMFFAYSSIIN
jgi:hypothetical protein